MPCDLILYLCNIQLVLLHLIFLTYIYSFLLNTTIDFNQIDGIDHPPPHFQSKVMQNAASSSDFSA